MTTQSQLISLPSRLPRLLNRLSKRLLNVTAPLLGIGVFLLLWSAAAANIETSLGSFPGPQAVFQQFGQLWQEHSDEQVREQAFYERQEERNAARLAEDPNYEVRIRDFNGRPTFISQIGTSLITVLSGFLLASAIAIPLGILIGLNQFVYMAANPIIQVLKPVSPLAWLPLVTIVVSAVYVSDDPMFEKSFVTSVITVTLCSLWPTLLNTAVGVASIESDFNNISRVLKLKSLTHVRKIVLPASVPMIFTGLRLSIGIAWMVLIAAEMLAQNPGLGKFVWDEFQNGSSESLSRILAAVLVIGLVGFLLDRAMLWLQKAASWDKSQVLR
ncbi:ABC transporter permease [Reinekea blandensis]|uniref:Nitrate transporter system, permease component n=1 Tax=Reinekea blandensis MED297 TaxID=314283 RepID=A4BCX4_9GAMM|nr:ABC transporter permease [Reinekea blandensis]EAR10056.1 nitrate transporter system, permease component [Reinekea sp. MED297] [Reinekea blandensis MED297]